MQKKNTEAASATSTTPSNQPLANEASTTTVTAPQETIPGQIPVSTDPSLPSQLPSENAASASASSSAAPTVSPQKVSQEILNSVIKKHIAGLDYSQRETFYGTLEKAGYSKDQIEKAREANPFLSLESLPKLKEKMQADLLKNPTPEFIKSYIQTLNKKGYDINELNNLASRVKYPAEAVPTLLKSGVDVRNEKGVQLREDGTPVDEPQELYKVIGLDKIGFGGKYDPIKPIADWAWDFSQKTGTSIAQGADKLNEGLGTIANAIGDSSDHSVSGDIVHGALQSTTGGVQVAFNVIPAAVTFNAGMDAINTTAEKNLSPENAKIIQDVTSLPFTIASKTANALGMDPKEGSTSAMVLELIDFAIAGAGMHAVSSGKLPFADRIKSIEDLKEISKQAAENKLTPEELTDFKKYSEALTSVNLEDIKSQAEKSTSPEAQEIISKIDDVQNKAKADATQKYLSVPNDQIIEASKVGETPETLREKANQIDQNLDAGLEVTYSNVKDKAGNDYFYSIDTKTGVKTEITPEEYLKQTTILEEQKKALSDQSAQMRQLADAMEANDVVSKNPQEAINDVNANPELSDQEKQIATEKITNAVELEAAHKKVEDAKVQHIRDLHAVSDPGSVEFYRLAEEALSNESVLPRVQASLEESVKSGELSMEEAQAQLESLKERIPIQEHINPAIKEYPDLAMKVTDLAKDLKDKEADLKKVKSYIGSEPDITIQNKERAIENVKGKIDSHLAEAKERAKNEEEIVVPEEKKIEDELPPPIKPPVEKDATPIGETPEEKVHAIWKRVLSEMKDSELAAGIEKEGVTYIVKKDAISESSARDIVSGAKQSGKMAELEKVVLDDSNGMDPVTRGVTSAMIGKDYFDMSEVEVDPVKKAEYLKEFFKYTDKAASLATEGGQMGNAIGKVIKKMYASNPETVIAQVNEFMRKNNEEVLAGKEDQIQQTYSSIKEILSSEEGQKAITDEIEKRATKIFGKETQQKISNLFDSAKIDTKGTLNSSIIPPQLINAAIEVMKQTALLGAKGLEIIEQGVLYIKENHKEEWDEAAFRKDWEKKLKDSGVEFGEKEKKAKEVKSDLEKAKAKLAKLEEAIKDPQKYLDELELKKKDLVESENAKPEELKDIEAQIQEKKAILKDLIAEIKGEKTGIDKKQQTLDDLEYYIENPAEYIKKLEEKRKAAQDREDAKPEEIKDIEEKISEARKELKRKVSPKQEKSILDIIEKKAGRLKKENRDKFLKDIVQVVEQEGGLSEQRFKDLYAQALGLETMTPGLTETIKGYTKIINEGTAAERAYLKALDDIIDAQNEGKENSVIKDLQQKKSEAAHNMVETSLKAKKANAALSELMKDNKKLSDTLIGMMQLGALTPGSLIKNITAMPAELAFRAVSGHVQGAADYLLTGLANIGLAPESWKDRTVNSVARSQGTWYAHPKALKKMFDTFLHGSFAEDFASRELHHKIEPVQAFKNLVSGKTKGDLSAMAANVIEALPQGYLAAGMGRALAGPDAFFRTIGEQAKAYELGTMRGLEGAELEKFMFEPPKEDLAKIQRAGDEITFQQDSKVSEMIKGGLAAAKRFSEKVEGPDKNRISKAMTGALRVIGKSQALYVKTPINVFSSVVRMVSPEYSMLKAVGALSKGDKEHFSKYMADVAVGYALRYVIVNAIKHNMVTPTVDYKSKEGAAQTDLDIKHGGKFNRSAYMRMLTGGDWQEQDDDIWVDYSRWTGGLGIAVGAYASMLDGVPKEEMDQMTMAKNSYKVLPTMMQQVMDLSFMSTTAMAVDAMRESDGASKKQKWFVSTVGTLATPLLPNTVTSVIKATSDTKKDVRSKDWIENLKNDFSYKLTGGSELPSKVTLWGDKVATAPAGSNKYFYYLFDVSKPENPDENSVGYRIMELARKTGDKRIVPAAPSNQITINKEKVTLDGNQFEQLQVNIGTLRKKMVKEYLNEEAYQSDDDAKKAYKLERIYNEAHKMGTEMLIDSDEHLTGIKNSTSNTTPVTGHRKPRRVRNH